MLQSRGLQRVRYKLATEQQSVQNFTIRKDMFSLVIFMVCNNAFPTNICTPVYQFYKIVYYICSSVQFT